MSVSSAATARSILSCPSSATLAVDGVGDVLDGCEGAGGEGTGPGLGLQDLDGMPTFSSRVGSRLALAANEHRRALLTVGSGLGSPCSRERNQRLDLTGHLLSRGREECACCTEVREVVVLDVDLVVLSGRERVPLADYQAREHQLNRGFLQRSVEHANGAHQDDLRDAVAAARGVPVSEIGGVGLTALSPTGVHLGWFGEDGAHELRLDFARPARSPAELGEMLRRQLARGLRA